VAGYSVGIKRSAAQGLDELSSQERRRVVERVRALAVDPRPRACEKLSGEEKYRIREGNLRIPYEIDDALAAVTIVKIGRRRDVYR
jgi:mRNA interferase RelE/StbE